MRKSKLAFTAGVIIGAAGVIWSYRASAEDLSQSAPNAHPADRTNLRETAFELAALQKKVEVCQATPDERKFDRIGWTTTILDAEKLAKEHNRPIFLFTHDGRINTGRC